MGFKDYFSKQSENYQRFRPQYPRELFEFIASQCIKKQVALDCATGNGQAAVALAEFFNHVIAVDGSQKQLSHAISHERIEYRQATAENTGVESQSVDCVTVAQALHWFDFNAFFKEVKRVLVPGGILAIWHYPITHCSTDKIDSLLQEFYSKTIGPYWTSERHYIDDNYRSISIPFDEIKAPVFSQEKNWTLSDFAGYLGTWSSVQNYKDQEGEDPVALFLDEKLRSVWGDPASKKTFLFEFYLRIARV